MGRVLLVARVALRDLRRRPTEAVLLLLVITATTTTLTLGLALSRVTNDPWDRTRAATAGPDVVAAMFAPGPTAPGELVALRRAPGVRAATGPYPVVFADLRVRDIDVSASAEARDTAPAAIDQPAVTDGRWIFPGGAVVERGFADALGVRVGDPITVAGRALRVAGIAVTTAQPAYPLNTPGQVWLARVDAQWLSTRPVAWVLPLRLADPSAAPVFAGAHSTPAIRLRPWQDIRDRSVALVAIEQTALLVGSWLLGLLAVASMAVLVGGRMAEQIRRVGLLKAVGATPRWIAVILLAEHVLLALAATVVGLAIGWWAAPLLTNLGSGLLGTPGTPALTGLTVVEVAGTAVLVAGAATLVPALRGAGTSTLRALTDPAHPPRRWAWLIAVSAHLPVPLLLGLRLAIRRPRRTILSLASLVITIAVIVAALAMEHYAAVLSARPAESGHLPGLGNPLVDRVDQVVLVLTVVLSILAAINAIFITWTTALDAQRACALARALGATPRQVSAGLSAAQLIPTLVAALLGIPAGLGLYRLAAGGDAGLTPPLWTLLAVVPAALIGMAVLTAIPARLGARRPIGDILRSE